MSKQKLYSFISKQRTSIAISLIMTIYWLVYVYGVYRYCTQYSYTTFEVMQAAAVGIVSSMVVGILLSIKIGMPVFEMDDLDKVIWYITTGFSFVLISLLTMQVM